MSDDITRAAAMLLNAIHGEPFTGDVAAALHYMAGAVERCGDDTEWCLAEVRGELIRLQCGH